MPDGSVLHVHPQGAVQFHDLGRGVVLHGCLGLSVAEFAPLVIDDCERVIKAHGTCNIFVDSYDAKMMTTAFREKMTGWVAERSDVVPGLHILLRSKLWEMAINIAKLVIRNDVLKVYSKIETWEGVGKRIVPTFARRPMVLPRDIAAQVEFR
jgi:hypothetical protein